MDPRIVADSNHSVKFIVQHTFYNLVTSHLYYLVWRTVQ